MSNRALTQRQEGIREAFAIMLAVQLGLGFLGFLTSALSARLLGPTGRGELAAVWSIPNLIAVIGGLGMGEASLYFTAKQPSATRPIVTESLRITLYGAAGALVVGVAILEYVIEDPITRLSAQLSLPLTFAVAVFAVCHQPLRALGYSRLWGSYRASITCAWLFILTAASMLGYRNIRGIALTFVVVQLAIAAWSTRLIRRFDDSEAPTGPRFRRRLIAYGLPSSMTSMPYFLTLRLDQVLMIGLVARSDLGIYTAAVGFSLAANFPFQALAKVVMPRIAAAGDAWRPIAIRLVGACLGLIVVTLLVAVPLTNWMFPKIMGQEFASGTSTAQLLIIAATIRGTADVLQETVRGLGTPVRAAFIEMIGLFVGMVALLALIGAQGITGAAVASILGYGTALLGHGLFVGLELGRRRPVLSDDGGNSAGPASQ